MKHNSHSSSSKIALVIIAYSVCSLLLWGFLLDSGLLYKLFWLFLGMGCIIIGIIFRNYHPISDIILRLRSKLNRIQFEELLMIFSSVAGIYLMNIIHDGTQYIVASTVIVYIFLICHLSYYQSKQRLFSYPFTWIIGLLWISILLWYGGSSWSMRYNELSLDRARIKEAIIEYDGRHAPLVGPAIVSEASYNP